MSLKCGIIGLPNVGKSTLFNCLTKNFKADAQNYPFCTIEPNVGIVEVPDQRLEKIAQMIQPEKTVPASIEFVDVAGLVKGASKGEGLGNQFLSHIRQTDALLHVIRCFEDEKITHVEKQIDPIRDLEIIETELLLSDLERVEKKLTKLKDMIKKTNQKELKAELKIFEKIESHLKKGEFAKKADLDEEEEKIILSFGLITFKPLIYIANLSESDPHNAFYQRLEEHTKKNQSGLIKVYVKLESEMHLFTEKEQLELLSSLNLKETSLKRLISESYKILKLQSFFTAGKQEVRAWRIYQDTKAVDAAGVIHSDFQKGFIKCEAYHCKDLFELGSLSKVKEKGKYRIEGKSYIVKDGDILYFKFNV